MIVFYLETCGDGSKDLPRYKTELQGSFMEPFPEFSIKYVNLLLGNYT